MPLHIDNNTHWRTKDVRRLVRTAMDAAGSVPTESRTLLIHYGDTGKAYVSYDNSGLIDVELPKRGTAKPHPNALIALAGAGVGPGTPLMPFQDVYRLAHRMAAEFARVDKLPNEAALAQNYYSINPPAWGTDLFIAKYADPTKDAQFVAFQRKAEAKIKTAQDRVDKWKSEKERAEKNLKRAQKDLKAAQKSLRDAKKRRGL
jgi:hypothetical protein